MRPVEIAQPVEKMSLAIVLREITEVPITEVIILITVVMEKENKPKQSSKEIKPKNLAKEPLEHSSDFANKEINDISKIPGESGFRRLLGCG